MEEKRPSKAPFRVAYEVYRDPIASGYFAQQRRVAQKKKQQDLEVSSKSLKSDKDKARRTLNFFAEDDVSQDELSQAESKKLTAEEQLDVESYPSSPTFGKKKLGRTLTFFAEGDSSSKELDIPEKIKKEINEENYRNLKDYFEKKIKSLRLKNPLIFYDDEAMRIDVGYGPREFPILFREIRAKNKKDVVFRDDYEDMLEMERQRLLGVAAAEFKKAFMPKAKITLDAQINNEKSFIEYMLKISRGFVVGEIHDHSSPKRFLIDHMKELADLGVTLIYMEHLFYERHQALLDEKEFPMELELYLKSLDEGHEVKDKDLKNNKNAGTFVNVVKAAKENGIRIIVIDSEATYAVGRADKISDLRGDDGSTAERYRVMNISMLERFKQYDDGGKYIAFVGSGHASTSHDVPGVSELLGCPNLIVHDVDDDHPVATFESDVDYEKGTKNRTHYDFLYHRSNELQTFEQKPKRYLSKGV
jgi:hypothetical protein